MKNIYDHIRFLQKQINHTVRATSNATDWLLYYFTLYQIDQKPQYSILASFFLSKLVSQIIEGEHTSLRGLFLLDELQRKGMITHQLESRLLAVDQYLYQQARAHLDRESFEDTYQATEITYYLTKRTSDAKARQYLQDLQSIVFSKIEDFHKLVDHDVAVGMDGLSGYLLMLIYIAWSTKNVAFKLAIKEGLRFLLSLRRDVDFSEKIYSYFPSTTQTGKLSHNAFVWNNSDLAPTVLIYQAALFYQDTKLANIADLTGLNTLLRKNDIYNPVENATFHQGAAGIAQVYQALYRISRKDAYREGHTFWNERTISLSKKDVDRYIYAASGDSPLTGITGILLTLFSLITDKELLWDKAILLRR